MLKQSQACTAERKMVLFAVAIVATLFLCILLTYSCKITEFGEPRRSFRDNNMNVLRVRISTSRYRAEIRRVIQIGCSVMLTGSGGPASP